MKPSADGPDVIAPDAIRQAGAVPWRLRHGRVQVLLVSDNQGRGWQIPKGNIEVFETPVEAAAKECFEEAGVVGRLFWRSMGHWVYRKRDGLLRAVDVYSLRVLEVVDAWPESNQRQRVWFEAGKAARHARDASLRPLIANLPHFLAANGLLKDEG